MVKGKLEAVLFVSGKSMAIKSLAKLVEATEEEVQAAIKQLQLERNVESSGIHLLEHDGHVQFVTNPGFATLVANLVKDEFSDELTRPQLETLSIILYRGPITKPEIEQIRGVNCSLILRNLLIRGLISEEEHAEKLQMVYSATTDFLRHLGVSGVTEIPEYDRFHTDERISKLIEESTQGTL